ncbi:hypothetical protein HRI_003100000 [Hibiscus trionum]|uniref:Uncharacterized protein n=1 Tax=Hibiscus trionum TaxID=183268 RepID=A0A9W7M8L8_HIBTR|nr:hypothetical protein HRI_003100000 [Hibiscus trionum]
MNLDMLEEIKNNSKVALEARNQIVAKYYNSCVRNKQFQTCDLVLRNIEARKPPKERGKMAPTWEGPYKIQKVVGFGAYKLAELDEKEVPRTWNARNMRKFYI